MTRPGGLIGAAAALLVAAWFGLGVLQADATSSATDVIFDPRARAELPDARAGLDRAELLRPGQDAALLRAQLDLIAGATGRGLREAVAVTRAEPDNLSAWRLVAAVAQQRDPALATEARAAVARLSPAVPAA